MAWRPASAKRPGPRTPPDTSPTDQPGPVVPGPAWAGRVRFGLVTHQPAADPPEDDAAGIDPAFEAVLFGPQSVEAQAAVRAEAGAHDQPGADPGPADDAAEDAEKEWWDDPSLPWRHKPSRADVACLVAMSIVAGYSLVMLPLQPVVLGLAPNVLGSLGYRTGLIMTGALTAVGNPWWPLVLVLGSLMMIKFHWVYWWAGKLWGREVLDVLVRNRGPRLQRFYGHAWAVAHRYETLALVLSFLPIPIPGSIVFAALGAAGMRLKKFLTVAILTSLVTSTGYFIVGYLIGAPAVEFMEIYARYAWYLSIAIIVGMVLVGLWRLRTRGRAGS